MSDEIPVSEAIAFAQGFQSVSLATLGEQAQPDISYAPFIHDELKAIYLLVSELAKHTHNMRNNPQVSMMFIEPEEHAAQIYARKRLIIQGRAEWLSCSGSNDSENSVNRSAAEEALLCRFESRHGSIIKMLRTLSDFKLVKLVPHEIRFIQGFGRAYSGESVMSSDTGEVTLPSYLGQVVR